MVKVHLRLSSLVPLFLILLLSLGVIQPHGSFVQSAEAGAARQEVTEPAPSPEGNSDPTAIPTDSPTENPTQAPATETAVPTTLPSPQPTAEPVTPAPETTAEVPAQPEATEPVAPETTDEANPELTPEVNPELTPELTPEATDELSSSPFEVLATCTETGVEFAITNLMLLDATDAYALVDDAALLENTEEPLTLEYTEFTLLSGETLTLTAGFATPALVLRDDEEIYTLDEPCEEIIPPVLTVEIVCAFETGISFTLSNSGGAMPAEQPYTITSADAAAVEGSFLLGANESITLAAGYGTPAFASGEIASAPEAPCYAPATVGGSVWNDFDGNGVRDDVETGLAGITVYLTDSAGFSLTAITVDDGSYFFGMLPTGSYSVSVDAATLAPDSLLTAPAGSNGAVALDVLIGTNTTVDFGYIRQGTASVSGALWLETTNFGVRDAGEMGVVGAAVLLVDASGVVVGFSPVDAVTGAYQFSEIPAGDYTVRLDQSTLFTPNGMTWNSDATLDYETPVTLVADAVLTGIDFGIVGTF